jgi:adenine C2-methylase RlmN of 23S rRNA A2503 and tRNA A37
MVEDLPGVSLALSLHAPNQALRQSIVPSARAYKLDKLMAAVDAYREGSGQKVRHLAGVRSGILGLCLM